MVGHSIAARGGGVGVPSLPPGTRASSNPTARGPTPKPARVHRDTDAMLDAWISAVRPLGQFVAFLESTVMMWCGVRVDSRVAGTCSAETTPTRTLPG